MVRPVRILAPALISLQCALAAGQTAYPAADALGLLAPCVTCHGVAGASTAPDIPHLDRQEVGYLVESMELLAAGQRPTRVSEHIPGSWLPDDRRVIARFYNRAAGQRDAESTDPELVRRGREVFLERCEACHEEGGRATDYRGTGSPILAGQRIGYVTAQIRAFLAGERRFLVNVKRDVFLGSPLVLRGIKVREQVEPVTEDDALAIAHFLAENNPR